MIDKAYESVDKITPHIMIAISPAEYENLFGEPYPIRDTPFYYIGVWVTKHDLRRGIKRWETLERPNPSQHENRQAVIVEHKQANEVEAKQACEVIEGLREELRNQYELGERVSEKLCKENADLKEKALDDAQLALAEAYELKEAVKVANKQVGIDAEKTSIETEKIRDQMFAANKQATINKNRTEELEKKVSTLDQAFANEVKESETKYREVLRQRDDYHKRLENLRVLADERIERISTLNPIQRVMRKVFRLP